MRPRGAVRSVRAHVVHAASLLTFGAAQDALARVAACPHLCTRPQAFSLTALVAGKNHDDCDVCGQGGSLLLCDGCPFAVHFGCLDPPRTKDDMMREIGATWPRAAAQLTAIGNGEWHCNVCTAQKVLCR